jgi:hypothetical protein
MLFAPLAAVGCTNPWKSNFEPNPEVETRQLSPTEAVQVRVVEFERLQRYSADERSRRIASTTAPQDLPPEEQLAAKNRLLEALQLRERGDEIVLLGWSEFTWPAKLEFDSQLQGFATKIGADYVVVASEYGGMITRTIDRPITTYSHSYATVTGPRGRRGRVITYSDTHTTWVPTDVTEPQYFYTAAFLRKARPGEVQ